MGVIGFTTSHKVKVKVKVTAFWEGTNSGTAVANLDRSGCRYSGRPFPPDMWPMVANVSEHLVIFQGSLSEDSVRSLRRLTLRYADL
jgi:hypothetical protein